MNTPLYHYCITYIVTPLFVLIFISYTSLTSIIFSLSLAFRLLLRRRVAAAGRPNEIGNIIAVYEGTVYHCRRHPVHNSFRFPARYALIDLDKPPYAPPNYLSADEARSAAKTNGPVYLLRIPPSLGYERSPVNLYYCYDIQGSNRTLKKCLVEASNTPWGESVTFVFNPSSDIVPKPEYISPFMDMLGAWRLKVNEPGEFLNAIVTIQHPEFGNYFSASFTATKVKNLTNRPEDIEALFWFLPHKISITAYWNALKLRWKNVPFFDHPRKENPMYREEAISRDQKIQFCPAFGGYGPINKRVEGKIDRCFMWKEAKWPWSCLIR